ncbi:discoidin domain-containing protein [Antarcticibacterium sp. 1MA-6-2]|uniref:discoidin domain-containing protein n=1 Tax=Antarcticibacterium sp. 1MA-6-2 TaxID=2908210 RepID=UPI001F203479|nr:discoidin domain-containing protein [Antarcticibacterium sp. 1MA-6-2]UJH92869.1 discoidin domain-containing protein [Antarcticibacterium sp. 1MA-6-2]
MSRVNIIFLLGILAFTSLSCEAKRDFPPLVEQGVVLDLSSAALIIGEELVVNPIFQPNVFPQKNYEWEASNPSIVDISMNEDYSATVLAKQEGTTTVRFFSADGELEATAEIIVTEFGPEDVTEGAIITVNRENGGGPNAGEGSLKLIDNDFNNKYLTEYGTDMWVQLELTEARAVDIYTLTSGNDAPERDAKAWTLEGSNDGTTWEVLDTRTDQSWSDRNQTKEFNVNNEERFKYYRLLITANNGSNLIQISEWRLMVISD